jgi:hypothetical protein
MAKRKTRKKSAARGAVAAGGGLDGISVAALHAELSRRQRAASALLRRRDRLRDQLAAIEGEIAAMGAASGRVEPGRKRARNASNLVEVMQSVLKNSEMSVTDLAGAVQAAGYVTTSPNFRTIVNQTLIKRKDMFKRVSRGLYTAK